MFRVLSIIITLMFGLSPIFSQDGNNKVLEYRNSKEVFTIVVVKGDLSKKEVKAKALKSAAKVAQKYGYRSFNVIQENEVDVIVGKTDWPSSYDFPQNLYQEEIVEKGYNRERIISGSKEDNELRKGLRIQFKCFYPDNVGSYKVCDLIPC